MHPAANLGSPQQIVVDLSSRVVGYITIPLTSVQICHPHVVCQSYSHIVELDNLEFETDYNSFNPLLLGQWLSQSVNDS